MLSAIGAVRRSEIICLSSLKTERLQDARWR
jgi:hypothetical protein